MITIEPQLKRAIIFHYLNTDSRDDVDPDSDDDLFEILIRSFIENNIKYIDTKLSLDGFEIQNMSVLNHIKLLM